MIARAALFALAVALAPLPASAQTPEDGAEADISGDWEFETEVYGLCQMRGDLTLTATSDPDVYEGRLMAYESCVGGRRYEAEQTTLAYRRGDQLVIESRLKLVRPSPVSYMPDNFALTIMSGALMVGELRSADIAPATFRRTEALIG
jgi:hypothetical protein